MKKFLFEKHFSMWSGLGISTCASLGAIGEFHVMVAVAIFFVIIEVIAINTNPILKD